MVKTIPIYIESKNGHDTKNVPEDRVQEAVEEQLNDEKWVTTEKEDGSTELLTKDDVPIATDEDTDWANKFKNIKSATATNKIKGG